MEVIMLPYLFEVLTMSTSIRNMSVFTNMITERAIARAQLWLEQGQIDDDHRRAEMYINAKKEENELMNELVPFREKDEPLTTTFKRVVTEVKDFHKFLTETLDGQQEKPAEEPAKK